MVYCAADAMSPFTLVDIEFPYQFEIKVNQDEVKANLRGLKNKPGTTKPADITSLLRHKAGYRNEMIVTYALTKRVSYPFMEIVPGPSATRVALSLSTADEEAEVSYGCQLGQAPSCGRIGFQA